MSRAAARVACALALATASAVRAADPPLLLNPFGDPFVQAVDGRPCPVPLGPAYTERERLAESHSRAERGTTCWLQGLCREPNAYRYDRAIADATVRALRAEPALAGASIWVTAQRRFVYLEGCVADAAAQRVAEHVAQGVPDVERVIPALALPGERPPYRTAPPAR